VVMLYFLQGYQNDFLGYSHYRRFSESKWDKDWRIAKEPVNGRSAIVLWAMRRTIRRKTWCTTTVHDATRALSHTPPHLEELWNGQYFFGRDVQKLVHITHRLLQKFRVYKPINTEDLSHLKNTLERLEKGDIVI